jgi:hypothetical protein
MFDPEQRQIAANLQRRLSTWVVMWAPWHREFVAISTCTRQPLILSSRVPDELVDRMRSAELAAQYQTAVPQGVGSPATQRHLRHRPYGGSVTEP